jgi:hypothetical protein
MQRGRRKQELSKSTVAAYAVLLLVCLAWLAVGMGLGK